jgi:secreted trypsin-like serine protease
MLLHDQPITTPAHARRSVSTAGRAAFLAVLVSLLALAVVAPPARAVVGGTDNVATAFAAPLVFLEIQEPRNSVATCTGTLISPTVVMTAAHCVYDTTKRGDFLRIAKPGEIAVRVGSTNVTNSALGVTAGVAAVLPQPYYRWDGSRHAHDVALLALDRALSQQPAKLAEQHPGAGKALLIAGYGSTSTRDQTRPAALKVALIDATASRTCHLVSESFDPSWLFCGAAASNSAVPGGTACYGDSGGPAFAYENTVSNLVVEGVISYGSRASCEHSRSYLVLVSSEGGFIDRALATPAAAWAGLRDDPPRTAIKPIGRHVGQRGLLMLRVNDDVSRHSRVGITFYTDAGKRVSRAFRSVTTNRWVEFSLSRATARFSGYVCAQATDSTKKVSNLACANDTVR